MNIDMISVEGGNFLLGGKVSVNVSNFQIGKYPVTQKQWQEVMGNNPSFFKGDDLPVETVSWFDVQEFLLKLNKITGLKYRLPTEAEWEYAARGGNQSKGYKYAGSNNIDEVGWYYKNSGSHPHPVAQKKPNELGLYDMSGNVWEWCKDWKEKDYCVIRGGSWGFNAKCCRVSESYSTLLTNKASDIGFRLAM